MQEKIFTFRKNNLTVCIKSLSFSISTQDAGHCHGANISIPSQVMNVLVGSAGIIAALSALQSALETQIGLKADSASTYTKSQVDTLLEDKADADNVYSKNTIDAKLLEVDTEIDNVNDALDEQSQQIDELQPDVETLETKVGRLGRTGTFVEQWTFGMMITGWGFIVPFINCNNVTISAVKVLTNNGWKNLVISNQPDQNYYLLGFIPCTVPTGVALDDGKVYLTSVSGTIS